jgi:membrane protein implicated in regulation of membrane protease activity
MPVFSGNNCLNKFIIFSGLLIGLFSVILYFMTQIGVAAAILSIAILSVVLRIIVDKYGDKMLTDSKVYMSRTDIEEFGKKKLDPSIFKSTKPE